MLQPFKQKAKMLTCTVCNVNFSGKTNLKMHEESIHKGIKHSCNDCGKQFTQKASLGRHINSVHKGIRYECDQCDKEFSHKYMKDTM